MSLEKQEARAIDLRLTALALFQVPMYQSECAPKSIRGAIVGAYQWMITSESPAAR